MEMSKRTFVMGAVIGATMLAPGCAALAGPETGSASDTQPFWRVRSGGSLVYIYANMGSVTPEWSAPRVEAAFSKSQVFWKETADLSPEDNQKFVAAGRAGDRPLSTWLTPEQNEMLSTAATEAGTTREALESLKPWLAAISINMAYARLVKEPLFEDPTTALSQRAEAQGKPVRAEFPDAESQLKMLNEMSPAAQVEFLFYTIENNRVDKERGKHRRRIWASGDLSLETRQVEHFKASFPNLYEVFEVQRNSAWPARIRQMLDSGETAFVMVGAWHMVGPDSVPVQLSRIGLTAERI